MRGQIVAMGGGGFLSRRCRTRRSTTCCSPLAGRHDGRTSSSCRRRRATPNALGRRFPRLPGAGATARSTSPTRSASRIVPAERVAAADVVVVAGGNTANMLAVWRLHGIDRALRDAWERGAALGGVSAGANCWFEACVTDSFSAELDGLDDGLGLLAGSFALTSTARSAADPSTRASSPTASRRDRLRRRSRRRLPRHRARRGRRRPPGRALPGHAAGEEPLPTRLLR